MWIKGEREIGGGGERGRERGRHGGRGRKI